MRSKSLIRVGASLGGAVAALIVGLSPAFAHFCYREFSDSAAANAAKSQAWLSGDEWLETVLPELEGEVPAECIDALEAFVSAPESENRLFLGPGLLAGGTLKNGKVNTPEKDEYLINLPECAGP